MYPNNNGGWGNPNQNINGWGQPDPWAQPTQNPNDGWNYNQGQQVPQFGAPNNVWQTNPNQGWDYNMNQGGQPQQNQGWDYNPHTGGHGWQYIMGDPLQPVAPPQETWGTKQRGEVRSWGDQQFGPSIMSNNPFADWYRQQQVNPLIQIKKKPIEEVRYDEEEENPFENWYENQKKQQESNILDPQGNYAQNIIKYIDEQIVYVEPSPIQKKLNELLQAGKPFNDDVFAPNLKSLSGEYGQIANWKSIGWKKMSEVIPNAQIFDQKVMPSDIKQGYLGDCYYLAALAALAETPQRIFNLFLLTEQNQSKYYACKILYKGKWKTIDLDEHVPCIGNAPAFSKAVGPELWVILLEKAWAKLYGSYKRIEAGYPEEGLHDLTGAHCQTIRFKAADFNRENTWRYLREASDKEYSMIASSQPGSDTNKAVSGIVLGHAYTVLAAVQLNFNGQVERLIQLRNPWGKGESNANWSDNDIKWNQVSESEKHRIGFTKNADDGSFFMGYLDFLTEFRVICVAEVDDNASYVYSTQNLGKGNANGAYFKVTIHKEGTYSFQVNQTPERVFEDEKQKTFDYSPATINIGKVTGNGYQYYEGSQSAYRTLFKKHTLTKGEYIVYTNIMWNPLWEIDYEITLAVYAQFACTVQNIGTVGDFHEKLFMSKAMKNLKQARPGVMYSQEVLKEGFIYSAVVNNSSQPISLEMSNIKNMNPTVRVLGQYQGQSTVNATVAPGQSWIILARVGNYDYPVSGIGAIKIK